ncbi:MAG: response regulator transcription factor [Oscillospiraceae bacterium]|nr:response regulator transcription factor [Oscillospiraceae bacterium]
MGIKILLVEDDENICNTVKAFLQDAGYEADACRDGGEALKMFASGAYHLVILDIMLPGLGGHELLREIRRMRDTPVMMMTALADDENQIRAFDAEADDYVTKPFKMQLLLKRAEALLRRSGALSKEVRHRSLSLRPDDYIAHYDGAALPLTIKEFDILLLLVQNKGRTMAHDTILSRVWGYDYEGDGSVVHTHIKNLRAKLPENIIINVRGVGYRVEDGGAP